MATTPTIPPSPFDQEPRLPAGPPLSTRQAAEILHTSVGYVERLLDEGKLPFRVVGTERMILFSDLTEYKTRDDAERRRIADELAADAQDLGIY